jgi:hypothetical protein
MTDPMIVEFVRVSEQGFNWTPVLQTTIGTFGGFLFGLIAYLIQRALQHHSDEKKKDDAVNDALKRTLACASSNIEVISMLKLQLLEALEGDLTVVRPLVDRAFEDDKNVAALVQESGKLQHFYKTLARAYELDPPPFSELSRVADSMPGLTTFIHRGMSSMKELQAISNDRNQLLAQHSKENAEGMNSHRVRYFASMLTDMSQALLEVADNATAFFVLVMEQVENYFEYGIKLQGFKRVQLLPEVKKRLPKNERFPAMRELLVDFRKRPFKR